MVGLRWILTTTIAVTCTAATAVKRQAPGEGDFADRSSDGSYAFRYADRNQFHTAVANKDNVVSGRFGSRSPETGRIVQTAYSAGPRGFRARGPDIARQPADLSQVRLPYSPPVPVDSAAYDPAYDRYHDPNEDPSYKFTVRTASQSKSETADSRGHVEGVYSYLDDVGKRHDVQYEAGAGTGFHVKSAHPDSDAPAGGFYSGPPGSPGGRPRGHSSVVLGKDGSYGFTATGPDQRRTEVSDAGGRVRGSYSYLDDKGVQRTVQYVAGPDIGYRVVNNAAAVSGAGVASLPQSSAVLPPPPPPPSSLLQVPSPSPLPPDAFEQDLFGPAVTGTSPAPSTADRRRPAESATASTAAAGPSVGPDGFLAAGPPSVGPDGFLSPGSAVPLGSAFPEDDPGLPPKKWPTVFKNKDEESFFQPLEKFDKRREQQQAPPKKTFGVPADSSYGSGGGGGGGGGGSFVQPTTFHPDVGPYGLRTPSGTTARPTAPTYTLYGQPARPIVVQNVEYGQYGGTDYQKTKGHDEDGVTSFVGRLPPGTVVKAHVQSLDILPFGYRVPSPSYVFEKQFGNVDAYQNSIRRK